MSDKKVTLERPEGPVTFTLPENDFTIDPTELDRELCNLGRIMLQYGEIEVELRLEVERKGAAIDKMEADLDTDTRLDMSRTGIKITEKKVESTVQGHAKRIQALESQSVSRRNWNMMRWVMKALDAKKDCLIALSYRERQLMKADQY